jgi:hypothetical protein
MNISRREFLKDVSALAAFSVCGLQGLAVQSPAVTTLDFFFHGLWAFIVTPNDITAVTPGNCEHCFVGGSFEDNPVAFAPTAMSLSGISAGNGKFDPTKNFITDLPQPLDPTQFRSRVFLPKKPDAIASRRTAMISFSGVGLKSLSIVQQLTYTVTSGPTLSNFNGWTQHPNQGKVNIHMYAEPNVIVGGTHAAWAMNDLCKKLKLNISVQLIGLDPGHGGILEDQVLSERKVHCTTCVAQHSATPDVDAAADVANCTSIILNSQ